MVTDYIFIYTAMTWTVLKKKEMLLELKIGKVYIMDPPCFCSI